MTIIKDMSSAFALVGRSVIGNPFFAATYITVLLWLLSLITGNTGIMLITAIWTIAYLLECMRFLLSSDGKRK